MISVNQLHNGTGDSVEDVCTELCKLREMAHALGLPNANVINWSLVSSSTSDSAATQKRFNQLMGEHKKADMEKYGETSVDDAFGIMENFCAMHLGVNLRKVFLSATKDNSTPSEQDPSTGNAREYHPVDTLVQESCKLLGKYGTPEYGCGVLEFPDFLEIMTADSCLRKC